MDIALARTFLMVAETGSFIDAARKMNITQSTVSARIKGLEDMLGRPLFERSKTGAELTAAGNQFQKHALALVRVWQHAQLEVGLSDQHRDHLAVGAPMSLWDGFMLKWVSWMRTNIPDIAVSASEGLSAVLTQRLIEGTLDLAVMYRPAQPPGHVIEHLFDEEFVLVTSAKAGTTTRDRLCFRRLGTRIFNRITPPPTRNSPIPVSTSISSRSASTICSPTKSSGYFPMRIVRPHLARGRLKQPKRARKFVYPVYMVYPETRDEEAFEPIIKGLRREAAKASRHL